MGTFRIDIEVESPVTGARRTVSRVLVDTGAELSWVPAPVLEDLGIERRKVWHFRQADGTVLERWTGFVIVHAAGIMTSDEVVFGEPGDLSLLGARSLEGLNVRVDSVAKRLVDAGPAPAACAQMKREPREGLSIRLVEGLSGVPHFPDEGWRDLSLRCAQGDKESLARPFPSLRSG